MSDVTILQKYVFIFFILGLVSPLLNAEFGSDLDSQDINSQITKGEEKSSLTFWEILGNIFLMPFWTFGLPAWVNLWVLSWIRLPFIFLIARNIWVGGGG